MRYYLVLLICLMQILFFECHPYTVSKEAKLKDGNFKSGPNGGCSCDGDKCSCCAHLDVPKIHLNETGCVLLEYIPDDFGVALVLTLNGVVFIKEEISLRNPPPICVGIPHLEKYASICIDFYNVTWSQKVGACVQFNAKLAGVTIEEVPIGCFYYPLREMKMRAYLYDFLRRQIRRFSFKQQRRYYSILIRNEKKSQTNSSIIFQ